MYDSWVAYFRTSSRQRLQRFNGRAPKSWDQFDEYDSQKLRSVMQTYKKTKVRRSEKFKSKFLISGVPALWSLRIDLRRRLKDRSDVPAETRGDLAKNILKLKETDKATFFSLTNEWSPSAIRNQTAGKIICCRFRREHPHVEQERPELCRIGSRKSLWKPDDDCCSQRRSANKRRSDTVCQRVGFIRDSDASRRYTGRSLTRKTLRRSRIFLPLDQWSETTTHQNGSRIKCNHGELRTDRCPWSIDRLFKLSYTHISDIITAGSRTSSSLTSLISSSQGTVTPTEYPASTRSLEYEWHWESTGTRRVDQQKSKIQIKWRQRNGTGKPVAWSARVVRRIYG